MTFCSRRLSPTGFDTAPSGIWASSKWVTQNVSGCISARIWNNVYALACHANAPKCIDTTGHILTSLPPPDAWFRHNDWSFSNDSADSHHRINGSGAKPTRPLNFILGLSVTLLTNRGIQFPFSLLTEITGLLCTRRYRNHHRLPCASEAFDYVMDWWMVNRSWQTVFYDPIWRRQKLHIDNLVMGKRLGNDRSAGVQNGDSKGPSDKTVRHVHHTLKIVTLMTSIWRKQDGMRK